MARQTLAAECARLHIEYRAAIAESRRLDDALRETLNADQRGVLNALLDAQTAVANLRVDWVVSELARHLPALAPVIRGLVARIRDDDYTPPTA